MKNGMILGVLLLIGGCAGTRVGMSWPGSVGQGQEAAVSTPPGGPIAGPLDPPLSSIDGIRRFKSEDGSMKFENVPLDTAPRRPSLLLDESCPRLPHSLMDPWQSFGSSDAPSAALLWSRGIPGVSSNGLLGPGPGWSR